MRALYLDASALVKLYVSEPESPRVEAEMATADILLTSAITLVEVHAALAARRRNHDLSNAAHLGLVERFEADLQRVFVVDAQEPVLLLAAELARERWLKANDAIHLASALAARRTYSPAFLAHDRRLNEAAVAEGFETPLYEPT